MDFATLWDGLRSALGLDEPHAAATVSKDMQVLIAVLLTSWIAHWVSGYIRRSAKTGRIYAEVAALVSRAAALAIFGLGTTVVLAVLGANWTAIAALLGAATLGISLALQDVGRSFVNGIYILIERPFRIGDRVRIGLAEGRVEEVGVRLTTLRTPGGDRVIVPNTVVFSSVIENSTVGRVDRQSFVINGIELPINDIETAVIQALNGTPHLPPTTPVVDIVAASPAGTDIQVTIEHDLGHRVVGEVMARLRTLFPEATVTIRSPAATT